MKITNRLLTALIILACMTTAAMAAPGCLWQSRTDDNWRLFKERFIEPDGRVIDTGNGGITHSEGQGFGLRLAVHHDDRETFERLWVWTRDHLYVRGDWLAAWRWRPSAEPPIEDRNNATDGDLFIAWSLSLAAEHWNQPSYRESAQAIAAEIRTQLLRESSLGPLLLPGAAGFERDDGLILNPSYWVFPALQELARLEPDQPVWSRLIESGRNLLDQARFGRWGLPPDWIALKDDNLSFPQDFAPRFGYDAIRAPLYLVWGGLGDGERLAPFIQYWRHFGHTSKQPDWVDLTNNAPSPHAAPQGIRSLMALTEFAGSDDAAHVLRLPDLQGEHDYYGAVLALLLEVALDTWCRASSS